MDKVKHINDCLKSAYDILEVRGYELLGVFLFGSQNYECDTEYSDVDIKAIVIPTVEQMITGNIEIKTTIKTDFGEITVFDIHHMHSYLKKQNVNFLEILFTKYSIMNDKYTDIYRPMFILKEDISILNTYRAMHALHGNFLNKWDKVLKAVTSNEEVVNKYGYDNKALADCMRYLEFMKRYAQDELYEHCLIPECKDKIVYMKTHHNLTVTEVKEMLTLYRIEADMVTKDYYEFNSDESDPETNSIIDDVEMKICKAYMNERCYLERWPVVSYS